MIFDKYLIDKNILIDCKYQMSACNILTNISKVVLNNESVSISNRKFGFFDC